MLALTHAEALAKLAKALLLLIVVEFVHHLIEHGESGLQLPETFSQIVVDFDRELSV